MKDKKSSGVSAGDKRPLVFGVIGVGIVLIVAAVLFASRNGESIIKIELPKGIQEVQSPSSSVTRKAVPVNVVVPDEKAKGIPENVAVPKVTAPSNFSNSATYRAFDIVVKGGLFVPDTIIANQWDTVHINLTAMDRDYDFTQSDFGFKLPLPKGQVKALEFGVTGQGNFLFYCVSCGGPASGPRGHLIVTVPKKP